MASELTSWTPTDSERDLMRRIDRVGRRMQWMDIAIGSLLWLAGLFTAVLALTLTDHWVGSLPLAFRWLLLVATVAATAYYMVRWLPVRVWRAINPAYVARRIEDGAPESKNSLINWIFLRHSIARASVRTNLMDRAGRDLGQSNLDLVLPWRQLWQACFVVIGAGAALAIYSVVSPKSTWDSTQRVFQPWADIERPTRVRIEQVSPGHAEITRGRRAEIRALIRGLRPDEPVRVVFSSSDGRHSQQETPMEAVSDAAFTFAAEIPPGPEGAQSDLTYRVHAGDAASDEYLLTLNPAPVLVVERLDFTYPDYTLREPLSQPEQGDINEVEGTRVRVVAKSSHAIRTAFIEFDPSESREDRSQPPRLEMTASGKTATAEFVLRLRPDRKTPQHSAYRLRMTTDAGRHNDNAAIHSIRVQRDLAPVVEILAPEASLLELPVNRRLPVEVRGLDPDYGLQTITLRAVSGGQPILEEARPGRDVRGQVVEKFSFAPQRLQLQPGDEVKLWAVAADNRRNPDGKPDSNQTRSEVRTIRILPPEENDPKQTEDSDPQSGGDRPDQDPQQNDGGKDGESQQRDSGESEGGESGESREGGDSGDGRLGRLG